MSEKEYIRAVLHHSRLPRSVRRRLRADLESDFAARRAKGQSDAEIIAAMGPADQLAAGFAEEFAPRPRSGRETAALAGAAVFGVLLLIGLVWFVAEQLILGGLFGGLTGGPVGGVGVIGGVDGPTVVLVSSGPALWPWILFLLLAAGLAVCLLLYRRWRNHT